MPQKQEVWQGTLALMTLKTLEAMGPLHGFGIARRIEQVSEGKLLVNYGTLYPALQTPPQAPPQLQRQADHGLRQRLCSAPGGCRGGGAVAALRRPRSSVAAVGV